jgi:hypothetical protein
LSELPTKKKALKRKTARADALDIKVWDAATSRWKQHANSVSHPAESQSKNPIEQDGATHSAEKQTVLPISVFHYVLIPY